MNILILHGIMGSAGENWGQWLHDSLIKEGHMVKMPSLPEADHPDRKTWLSVIESELDDFSNPVIVGHSLGVTSALDYLEVRSAKALLSVSGFAEAYGMELNEYFLQEKHIDFDRVTSHLEHSFVFYGDNDPYVTQDALRYVADKLGVEPVVFKDGGHLNAAAGFNEFPALLTAIESLR